MQLKTCVLSILLVLLVAASALAQDGQGYHPDYQLWAWQWNKEFTKLSAQIPTLSPREERWLKTEVDDTIANARRYTDRALAAMDSREYDLRVAKPHVQKILRTTAELLKAEARDPKQEVALWTQLAVLFMNLEFWQSVDGLVQRKIVRKKINGVDGHYYENHVLRAQEILEGPVMTYLKSQR